MWLKEPKDGVAELQGGYQELRRLATYGNPMGREEKYTDFPLLPISGGLLTS